MNKHYGEPEGDSTSPFPASQDHRPVTHISTFKYNLACSHHSLKTADSAGGCSLKMNVTDLLLGGKKGLKHFTAMSLK